MTFKINRVYTRSGDSGETGLVGGARVSKADLRVRSYGDIDELNSQLGLLKERLSKKTQSLKSVLEELQQELFDLGSEIATAPADSYPQMILVSAEKVTRLEALCDKFGDGLPELESFLLPGGSEVAALCHVARCVCRRAERQMVELVEASRNDPQCAVRPEALQYMNRLSDLLFVLARWSLKEEGKDAPLWRKGR